MILLARLHEVQKSYCSQPGRMRSRSTVLKFSRSLYLDNHRDVHLSHFCIFLRIEFQKMRMMFLRIECDFAEKSGQFCDFAAKI